jgi:UrcA family protein
MRKRIGRGELVVGAEHSRRRAPHLSWEILPLLLAGAASESLAAPEGWGTNAITVRYNRMELTSAGGARNLLKRIGDAALESCGASPFSLAEFKAATEQSRCWRAAVDDAVRSIGSPVLNAAATGER